MLFLGLVAALPMRAQTTITLNPSEQHTQNHVIIDETTLSVASGFASFRGSISGSGSIIKTGSGNLAFSNPSSPGFVYTGDTIVNEGTLYVYAPLYSNGTTAASVVVNNGGTLVLGHQVFGNGASIPAVTLTINAGGAVEGSAGSSTYLGNLILNGGELRVGDGFPTITLQGTVTVGGTTASRITIIPSPFVDNYKAPLGIGTGTAGTTTTFDVADATNNAAADLTITARLTGAAPGRANGLIKTGAGTLALEGFNDYAGTTTLAAGTLALHHTLALGTSQLVITGGNLSNASGADVTLSTNNAQQWNSDFSFTGPNALNLGTGTVTLSQSRTVNVTAGTLAIGGAIGDGGSGFALTKTGSGTLALNGASTYSGGTTLAAGTLSLSNSASLGSAAGSLNVTGPGTIAATASFNTAHAISLGSALTFDAASGTTIGWQGAIAGTGSLTKIGAGTVTLDAANSYLGGTTVTAGTLALGADGSLAPTGTLALNGGTFDLGANHQQTVSAFTLTSGQVTGAASSTLTAPAYAVQSGAISARLGGTAALTKTGSGSVTLSGDNTYAGGTLLSAGTLAAGSDTAFGTGTVSLDGGALQAAGGARTVANAFTFNTDTTISGTEALTLGGTFTLARNRDLTLTNTAVTTISGTIAQSGGPRYLAKYGAGELALTGANTYTGGTLIAEGTVRTNNATGSAFGTGAVTVAHGATLTGAGSFTGALQLNGTYSPGNSPGQQSTGSQTWGGGATYVWEINDADGAAGSAYDLLSISGTLTIAAATENKFTLSLVSLTAGNAAGELAGFDASQNYSYTIASASGGILGFDADKFAINTAGFASALAGGSWSLALDGNNLNLAFTAASAIPEPSTYAMLAGLAALAMAALRRR